MPMSTRELYLVLRARDEASRTLRGLSRELLASGAAAQAASARARSGIERETAARARRDAQIARDLASQYRAIAASRREQIALGRMTGMTQAQADALRLSAIHHDRLARSQEVVARGFDRTARASLASAQALDQSARAAEEVETRHRHMINIVEQSGQAVATAGVGLVAVAAAGAIAIKNLVDVSVEYERQVRHTATQIDGFKGNLQELGDIGRRLARDFAVPFEQIQPALFDIFSSTEANVTQAEMLLRAFAKAAVAGQVDIQSASRATIGLLNAFSLPLEDVNRVLDIQFQLVKEGVGDYSEWADKIGLVSPSAARAGQSIEVMAAALATATRMGMTAARASTSVARALDAMSNPKVIGKLKEMGINALDATGHMRPLNEVLRDLRTALMNMPEKDRVGAILDIFKGAGGTIEARRFLQTMLLVPGTLEQFDQILGNIKDSAGSTDAAYSQMANSAASKTELLRNKWMLLKEALGTALTPAFVSFVTWLSNLLDKFNNLSPEQKKFVAGLLVAGTALAAISGVLLVVVGGLAVFIAAIAAAGEVLLPVIAIILGLGAGLAVFAAAMYTAWQNSGGFRTLVIAIKDEVVALWNVLSGFARDLVDSFQKELAPALANVGRYIDEVIIPAFRTFHSFVSGQLIDAVKEVTKWIWAMAATAMRLLGEAINSWVLPAIKFLTQAWIDHREQLQPIISFIILLVKWFGIIVAIIVGVVAIAVGGVLVAVFASVIAIIGVVINIIGFLIGTFHNVVSVVKGVGGTFAWLASETWRAITQMADVIGSIPGKIRSSIGDLGSLLVNQGRALIDGLISGIRDKLGALGDFLGGVGDFIANHKGPLPKDRRLLIPAGLAIMAGLIQGIRAAMPSLDKQIDEVNGKLNVGGTGSVGDGEDGGSTFRRPSIPPPPPTTPMVKNYYVTQNITTQEINPVRQAAALGWEVATVI